MSKRLLVEFDLSHINCLMGNEELIGALLGGLKSGLVEHDAGYLARSGIRFIARRDPGQVLRLEVGDVVTAEPVAQTVRPGSRLAPPPAKVPPHGGRRRP